MMGNILAIDTATNACSAAVQWHGAIYHRWEQASIAHGDRILVLVDAVLSEAGAALSDLDAIAFGCGPGSFTGLRIGVGAAQGLAFAANISLIPISNLAILAQQGQRRLGSTRSLIAMDARMGEIYWARYTHDMIENRLHLVGEESVCRPDDAVVPADAGWAGIGTGWHAPALRARCLATVSHIEADWLPDSLDALPLAQQAWRSGLTVRPVDATPTYLRNNVAHVR